MRFLASVLCLLLLAVPALAFPTEADQLAKAGAYSEADRLYLEALKTTRDPQERQVLLLRRMALAQLRNDVGQVYRLGDELGREKPEPQIEMRMRLIEGAAAYRTGNLARADRAFARAKAIASGLHTTGAALALSECFSYEYQSKLDREGKPTPQEYAEACKRSLAIAQSIMPSASDQYWPLDISRAGMWSYFWGTQAWEYSYLALRAEQQQDVRDWSSVAIGILTQGYQLMMQTYLQSRDLEFAFLGLRLSTALCEEFTLLDSIKTLMDTNDQALDQMETLEKQFMAGGVFEGTEQLKGVQARARARYALLIKHDPTLALSELEKAANSFERAGSPVEQIETLVEIGYHCFLTEGARLDRVRVEKALRQALALSEKVSYAPGRFWASGFLGRLLADKNDLPGAEKLLVSALKEANTMVAESGASFRAKQEMMDRPETRLFSETLVDVLLKQGKKSEALEASTTMGAQRQIAGVDLPRVQASNPAVNRSLRDIEARRQQGDQLRAELQAAEAQQDKSRASTLRQQLASNKTEFYKAVNELRAQSPEFERLITVKPASFASIQARLPEDALLVQFAPYQKQLMLFVATRQDLKIYQSAVSDEELNALVVAVRRRLTGPQAESPELAELYQLLIAPLEKDLVGKKLIIVVPSGPLFYVPFAALRSPGGYLVEKQAVVLATSADILNFAQGQPTGPNPGLLALANPDRSLPGARQEVNQVAPLFPQHETYFEDDATRAHLSRPGGASIVHLATHGVLNSENVNESYLLLAGPEKKLTTVDIYGLPFEKVSLVTLSACQTNLGERKVGFGSDVATLAQAFSIAGSRSLLASLWKVDDQATAELMVEFYTHLKAGKSKAEALRLAQLKQLGKSPFYWAAFELIGDWQ